MRGILKWIWPRWGGVRVSRPVVRLIDRGRAAQRHNDWTAAACAYAAVIDERPDLAGVWVQLGHVRKESGDLKGGLAAYESGYAAAPPGSAVGHDACHWAISVAQALGDNKRAAELLWAMVRGGARGLDPILAVLRLLSSSSEDGALLKEMAEYYDCPITEATSVDLPENDPPGPLIFLDLNNLLGYFCHTRLPSGIQRVQMEVARAVLDDRDDVALCCHMPATGGWKRLDPASMRQLFALSLASDDVTDPVWRRAVIAANLVMAAAPALRFPRDATLVNLGPGWSDGNYFLDVHSHKALRPLGHVTMVYDLIPLVVPHLVTKSQTRECGAWLTRALHGADGFLAISQATAADLRHRAAQEGVRLDPAVIGVVPLDADFRRPLDVHLDDSSLRQWKLAPGGFVLFVSTIEPRKNHEGALNAWLLLVERLGKKQVPTLVIVGRPGWGSQPVMAMIAQHARQHGRVKLLTGISDAELDLLYRCCLFTLYPSHYEGWGLPVTESLCYGKVPVAGSGSSLREAGGGFALHVDADSPQSIAETVAHLITRPEERQAREQEIARNCHARNWSEIADDILRQARQLASAEPVCRMPPTIRRAVTYSFAAIPAGGSVSGEIFRDGPGWARADVVGNVVTGGPAALSMTLPDDAPAHLIIRVRADSAMDYCFLCADVSLAEGRLDLGEERMIGFDLPIGVQRLEIVITAGSALRVLGMSLSGEPI